MMTRFPVRHYRCHPLPGVEYDERNFGAVERVLEVEAREVALVTVDLWNMNYEPEPLVPELGREAEIGFIGLGARACAEARLIMDERIAPVLARAREAGLTVVHCNSERVVKRYPECLVEVEEAKVEATEEPWPPVAVRQNVLEDYVRYTWGDGAEQRWEAMRQVADFPAPVRPVKGDYCVYQQAAFDQVMRERRVTTLVYVGFLLGHCLLDKPGGLRSTAAIWRYPGYRTVVLRDCTVAQESAESIDGFLTTKAFIFWLEASSIPTATAGDFAEATRSVS